VLYPAELRGLSAFRFTRSAWPWKGGRWRNSWLPCRIGTETSARPYLYGPARRAGAEGFGKQEHIL
jgi:hypothetical protein